MTFLFRAFFFSCIFLAYSLPNVFAEREFNLAQISISTYDYRLYHSHTRKTLLISLINKNKTEFQCQPNRYIIYNYKKDAIYEIFAGNLKTTSLFNKAFYTKINVLRAYRKGEKNKWKSKVKILLAKFNVSSNTLEKSKVSNQNKSLNCWQQAAVIDFEEGKEKTFPIIVANICKSAFCSDFFWKNHMIVQSWIQITPKKYHLAMIDTKSGQYSISKSDNIFYKGWHEQHNAPLDNIITKKNQAKGKIKLVQKKGKKIIFNWSSKKGVLTLKLKRNFLNLGQAKTYKYQADKLIKKKKFTKALRKIEIGEWLGLPPLEKQIINLRVFKSMQNNQEILKLIENQSEKDKTKLCQIIHSDQNFKILWKEKGFSQKFSEVCG